MSLIQTANEISLSRCTVVLARLEQAVRSATASGAPGFPIFKANPFDPRLRAHKIHRLSAQYGRTIYAVDIAGDLRATFFVEGETVWSVSIGTHDIY